MFDICIADEEKYQNHFIESLKPRDWKLIPNEKFFMSGRFDLENFFNKQSHYKDPSYYHYVGSLSSPPCTENIERFVLALYFYEFISAKPIFLKLNTMN